MESSAVKWFKRIEVAGLWLLAFSLPNFSTPKGIATGLFLIGGLGWRFALKPFVFRRPDMFETLLLFMWLAAAISTLANWPLPNGVKGLSDEIRFLLIGWLLYRNRYTEDHIRWFLVFLIAGTLVGLAIGFRDIEFAGHEFLEFNSIAGVNRSAIYLALMLTLMLGILLDRMSGFTRRFRLCVFSGLIIMLACLLIMGSRGAVLGFLSAFAVLMILFVRRIKTWLHIFAGLAFALAVTATLMTLYDRPAVAERSRNLLNLFSMLDQKSRLEPEHMVPSDLCRYEITKVTWAQIRHGGKPFLGLGPGNFGAIRVEDFTFVKPLIAYPEMWKISHAHNGFLTKTCEEGLFGLAALLAFLGYAAIRLMQNRPHPDQLHWSWPSAAGALLIALVAGMFNSVLINEMGWLAMMLIGIGMNLASLRSSANPHRASDMH